jgi:predicted dehydrogenase
MLRVAIVGISGYGAILTDILRRFASEGKLAFIAAAVINREEEIDRCKTLEAEKVRIFRTHQEMLRAQASRIDLCIIPVGIPWHATIAIDALRAGCDVFLEKPLAGSYVDAARICKIARLQKRRLMVGFQDLSDPGVWKIKDALLSGAIGSLQEIRAAGAWPRSLEYYQRNAWAGKLIVDGVFVRDSPHNNALAHLVNLALFWGGKTRTGSAWPRAAQGRLYRFLPIESFDTGWIEWTLYDGPRIICAASHSSEQVLPPQILIQGTGGSLLWDYERGLISGDALHEPVTRPDAQTLRELAVDSALSALRGEPSCHCDADHALAHAKAIDLAHGCLPIESRLAANVFVDYREEGEYRSVRGIEQWCNFALTPAACAEAAESFFNASGRLDPVIN